jgi:hypothetical protein
MSRNDVRDWKLTRDYFYGPSYGIVVQATHGEGDMTEGFEICKDDPDGVDVIALNRFPRAVIDEAVRMYRMGR